MSTPEWLIASSSLAAFAVGTGAWSLGRFLFKPVPGADQWADFERMRRGHLRNGNATYRLFESLIERLAVWNRARRPDAIEVLRIRLVASGEALPWLAEETMAVGQIEGGLVGLTI